MAEAQTFADTDGGLYIDWGIEGGIFKKGRSINPYWEVYPWGCLQEGIL
jgi:hypothetical protein